MIIGSIVIFIYIKPYYFFALLPGSLIWIFFQKINNVKNPLLRIMIVPILLSVTILLVIAALQIFGSYLGEYSLDLILAKAVKTQQDLIRVEYGGQCDLDISLCNLFYMS
jgi:hypothetical protein